MMTSAGYDPTSRVLEIEFATGAVYHYVDVPLDVYQAMLDAPSLGQFFPAASATYSPATASPGFRRSSANCTTLAMWRRPEHFRNRWFSATIVHAPAS